MVLSSNQDGFLKNLIKYKRKNQNFWLFFFQSINENLILIEISNFFWRLSSLQSLYKFILLLVLCPNTDPLCLVYRRRESYFTKTPIKSENICIVKWDIFSHHLHLTSLEDLSGGSFFLRTTKSLLHSYLFTAIFLISQDSTAFRQIVECVTKFDWDTSSLVLLVEEMIWCLIHKWQIDWRCPLSAFGYSDLWT